MVCMMYSIGKHEINQCFRFEKMNIKQPSLCKYHVFFRHICLAFFDSSVKLPATESNFAQLQISISSTSNPLFFSGIVEWESTRARLEVIFALARVISHSTIPEENEGLLVV